MSKFADEHTTAVRVALDTTGTEKNKLVVTSDAYAVSMLLEELIERLRLSAELIK